MLEESQVNLAAYALHAALQNRTPIEPLRDTHPGIEIADAYCISEAFLALRKAGGERVIGKKIGVTSAAVQAMLGIDQPDYGFLTDRMWCRNGVVDSAPLIAPRAEAEIAFRLGEDLRGPGITPEHVLAASEAVMPCFEIVDSRIKDWNIGICDTIADNASCGVFVLGANEVSPNDLSLKDLKVTVRKNGGHLSDGAHTLPEWSQVNIVFDATSAKAHAHHHAVCTQDGKQMVDLTPAAIGPYCVPVVNMSEHLDEPNVNMVSCGGQAIIPIMHAVRRVSQRVPYAEVVASVASRSAGPGTRANIDEFTETTARGLDVVGGAERGKAIIVLNPAEPPMIMFDTVYTLAVGAEQYAIEQSVEDMVREVQGYVPGFRLKQTVQFERFGSNDPLKIPGMGEYKGIKSTVFLEVEGAGHALPRYAGNLDIMTSAALATGSRIAELKFGASDPQ